MEIIRSKRASSTAGANTTAGQTKSKYRKRSVSRVSCSATFQSLIVGLDSGPHLLVNVIHAISGRLLNGGEDRMVRVPCATRADFVCICN
jgi:hypothetical protein